MADRAEMFAKEIDLAASRAQKPEERDLMIIVNEHATRGMATSGANVQSCHERRWRTVTELLALRLRLEWETPLLAEDETSWYECLVACIHRIVGQEQDRLLRALDQDYRRFLGSGPLPDPWRGQILKEFEALRSQYLKEAEIRRDRRALEAKMPKPPTGITLNISQSSIANLNLGSQVGQIQSAVGGLHDKGLQEIAAAIKELTESIVNEVRLDVVPKREAVEMVSVISEEIAKPEAERRSSVLRMAGTGVRAIVMHVDKLAAAYELVRIAARSLGVDLP
jgi:hypothetical protein